MEFEEFVAACRAHVHEPEALANVRASVKTLLADPAALAPHFPAPADCAAISGQSDEVFVDDSLSIMVVHTPPAVEQPPHDHLMSVVIGGFRGIETQRLFRRAEKPDTPIVVSGHAEVGPGDVFSLGPSGIHAINAVGPEWSGAVHVYLGRLSAAKRSLFHPDTLAQEAMDLDRYDALCKVGVAAR